MKTQWPYLILLGFTALLLASRNSQDRFDKITVREFELVDENGKQRASIKVEPEGEIVFRLRDDKGTIRVKIGAGEDGSGLVMLDKNTNPAVHVLAKQNGAKFTLTDKEGKKREY
ncbi:MAG: hypothetical protein AABY93_11495 [Bacteroidota bacterium]